MTTKHLIIHFTLSQFYYHGSKEKLLFGQFSSLSPFTSPLKKAFLFVVSPSLNIRRSPDSAALTIVVAFGGIW